jgi:hypothetical protein
MCVDFFASEENLVEITLSFFPKIPKRNFPEEKIAGPKVGM